MADRVRQRRAKRFYPRINPLIRFETEGKFRRRYRLDKETVRELAEDFGASDFAPQGLRSGGGMSHEERVCINAKNKKFILNLLFMYSMALTVYHHNHTSK